MGLIPNHNVTEIENGRRGRNKPRRSACGYLRNIRSEKSERRQRRKPVSGNTVGSFFLSLAATTEAVRSTHGLQTKQVLDLLLRRSSLSFLLGAACPSTRCSRRLSIPAYPSICRFFPVYICAYGLLEVEDEFETRKGLQGRCMPLYLFPALACSLAFYPIFASVPL